MVAVNGHGEMAKLMREAREEFRMESSFRMGARNSRFRPPPSADAALSLDYQIRDQYQLERSYATANQLICDHPLVRTALEQRVAMSRIMDWNPKPETSSPDLNRLLKKHWQQYASDPKKCDVHRKRTFAELSASALFLSAAHGDCVAPITESSAIKLCEAYRMRSPRQTMYGNRTQAKKWGHLGVVRNADGQALSYWLTKEPLDPLDIVRTEDVEEYPAYDDNGNSIFLHPMAPGRQGSRGISLLAPVADLLYMQMDLHFTKLVQEQVSSCVMFSKEITAEGWEILKSELSSTPGAVESLLKSYSKAQQSFKAAPGAIDVNFVGQSLKSVGSNLSPQNFVALNEFFILALAVNLDCPALAITLDATKANFSQFRNVVHQARMRFENLHQWWTPQWHKPVYEHVMRRLASEALDPQVTVRDSKIKREIRKYFAEGGTQDDFLAHSWSCPEYEYIEPVKDITAEALARAEGCDTDEEWAAQKKGRSWEEFAEEMVNGRALGIGLALAAKQRLKQQFAGDEEIVKEINSIPWTVLLPIPMPKAYQPMLENQPDPPQPVAAGGVN